MQTLTLNFTIPGAIPQNGYVLKYRQKGSSDPYTQVFPNPTSSPVVISNLPDKINFEGSIMADCGFNTSTLIDFMTGRCFCPDGYTTSPDGSYCYQVSTMAPTVSSSNVCFAAVTNGGNYSIYGARIYKPGLSAATLSQYISASVSTIPGGDLDGVLNNSYWSSQGSSTNGPMNKAGVWLDSDCNGSVDSLTQNSQATIAWSYYNAGGSKQVYVGVGADNQFILQVNNTIIAQTTIVNSFDNFRNWHMIPVTLINGNNSINVVATGDGSTSDCIAFDVYDNTLAQVQAATKDSDLNILFTTATLRGTRWNIATCPAGFDLDTSGGVNNYICKKTNIVGCA
jgi:hypothetical protein